MILSEMDEKSLNKGQSTLRIFNDNKFLYLDAFAVLNLLVEFLIAFSLNVPALILIQK